MTKSIMKYKQHCWIRQYEENEEDIFSENSRKPKRCRKLFNANRALCTSNGASSDIRPPVDVQLPTPTSSFPARTKFGDYIPIFVQMIVSIRDQHTRQSTIILPRYHRCVRVVYWKVRIDNIYHPLEICLCTWFKFNGEVCEQITGTPMGSFISRPTK